MATTVVARERLSMNAGSPSSVGRNTHSAM